MNLTKPQTRALKTLSIAEDRFEPLALRSHVSQEVADELVALGLVESGPCFQRYRVWGHMTGYRLTGTGRTALGR